MKITITDINELNKNTVVYFRCDLGNGLATWMNSETPFKSCQYDAEFDIEKSIDKVLLNEAANNHKYCLKLDGSAVIMNGVIESIEDDGMAYYRLSQDCIIMIESGKSDVKEGDWLKLRLEYSDLGLTVQGA